MSDDLIFDTRFEAEAGACQRLTPLGLSLGCVGPERAALYVDTSGEPLFKRGWRIDKGDAPLKETLAAAMLAAADWRGTPEQGGALHDPCCGSGTIPIEAALIACDSAPGLQRRFAFERQLPFTGPDERALWQQLKAEAKARIHASAVPIHASDVSFRMVDFAQRNAQRAGVDHALDLRGGDALQRMPPVPRCRRRRCAARRWRRPPPRPAPSPGCAR